MKLDYDHDNHDDCDDLSNPKGDGSCWLSNDVDRIHKRVHKTGESEETEKHESYDQVRVREHEEDAGDQEYGDILQVIEVSSVKPTNRVNKTVKGLVGIQ
jgi:hypothetical protein